MAFVCVRIDNRLIHGQVANLWINSLKPTRAMVIDDEASDNVMQKQMLKMATPSGVSLSVLSTKKAIENIKTGKYDSQKVMIVVKTPYPIKALLEAGISLPDVIVGNMPRIEGVTRKVANAVEVSEEDVDCFKYINKKGVRVLFQQTPANSPENFIKLL